jgi:F-type H+-transporting ATPase subunit epsilon
MAEKITLEVVTPEKIVVSEEAQIVSAPGTLGEFGVLVGHTPFMTTLKTGSMRFIDGEGTEHYLFISGGFAEALPRKVTVLAESAERRREIDMERAMAALERAQKRMEEARKRDDIDFTRARAALERALQRVRMAESRKR